jgi:hypothetical protein
MYSSHAMKSKRVKKRRVNVNMVFLLAHKVHFFRKIYYGTI